MKSINVWIAAAFLCMVAGSARSGPTSVWIKSVDYNCNVAIDDTIRVDVMVNSINAPIDDVLLGISYVGPSTPEAPLTFIRAERGALAAGWVQFDVVDGPAGGLDQVTITATNAVPIPAGISGRFATLVFVQDWCPKATDTVTHFDLCVAEAGHDLLGVTTFCGAIRFTRANPGALLVESAYQTCGAALGDTVEIDVRIESAPQPVDAAGVDIVTSPQLEYVGYKRGDLTATWPFFDAADVASRIRVGGFTQTPIPGGSSGVFVTLRFVARCCQGSQNAPLCADGLVDDFESMTTTCGVVSCVPLGTKQSTWGYVKSLYR